MRKTSIIKGVAALAAAGAGIVAVRQMMKTAKGRALRASAEDMKDHIAARVAKLGKVTRTAYGRVVDEVVEGYRAMKTVSGRELEKLSADLKGDWQNVRSVFKRAVEDGDEEDLAA